MHDETINKLNLIQENIKKSNPNSFKMPKIICVSKTFSIDKLNPLIKHGHHHFGENKMQEAIIKWSNLKKINANLKLHMVGRLQTNKVKKALGLFDFIHSLDSMKLADILKKYEQALNKKLSYFIQINIGNENQKSGILPKDAKSFARYCTEEINLNVIGLMVIPPNDDKTAEYFEKVSNLNSDLGFKELSMGMSADYLEAVKFNSTFLRIGSAILGERSLTK
ncbi:MAG: YggS family pyridoxal phosphate-dependent enzyme [Pelagibacteraceae bacterium]|nr:YggS family pyridoxal phosphate-dependent enzyme [Pelagibacteraceae bacterium]